MGVKITLLRYWVGLGKPTNLCLELDWVVGFVKLND